MGPSYERNQGASALSSLVSRQRVLRFLASVRAVGELTPVSNPKAGLFPLGLGSLGGSLLIS